MAKVNGGLFSMEARGGFGGSLVFMVSKGRAIVRQLVTPANPKTLLQSVVRNAFRVAGAVQHQVNLSTQIRTGQTKTDKTLLTEIAPSGQSWNAVLVKALTGVNSANYADAKAEYAALAPAEKTAWNTAADGLTPRYLDVQQRGLDDAAMPAVTPGESFYHHVHAMAILGIATAPGAVPPVYA